MTLPTAAELATTIKAAFDADSVHTSAWDKTPLDPFVAGGVKDEVEKALAKAKVDGFTTRKVDFLAWTTGELSYILRWSVKLGEPYASFCTWLEAWTRAVGGMNTVQRSNLLNHKPKNPYFRKFELTYPIHDSYRHHPGDPAAIAAEIATMDRGADIVAELGLG